MISVVNRMRSPQVFQFGGGGTTTMNQVS